MVIVALTTLPGLADTARAQSASQPHDLIVMTPLVDRLAKRGQIQVYEGHQPAGGDWSSIFVATLAGYSGLLSCTATKVGPTTLLTAAHCIDQGDDDLGRRKPFRKLIVAMSEDGKDVMTFACDAHDRYFHAGFSGEQPRNRVDYALCALVAGAGPARRRFDRLPVERLNLVPLIMGDPVLITGFGCVMMKVDLAAGTLDPGPSADVFNIGDERVETVASRQITTLSAAAKEPALCKGDSGGPLFTGASERLPDAERDVRAVNSMVGADTHELISTMVALSSTEFRELLGCWRRDRARDVVKIRDQALVLVCNRPATTP